MSFDTDEQRAILKAHILNTPALAAKAVGANADFTGLAAALNAVSAQRAWLESASVGAVDDAPSYTDFDTLSAGKRDSWALFLRTARNFARGKVRSWVTDVWGLAVASSNAEKILLAGTELATVAQVVIGGTTRTTGTVAAIVRNWTGTVSIQDLNDMAFA